MIATTSHPQQSAEIEIARSPLIGLSSSWEMLSPAVRNIDPATLGDIALSQVHEGQRFQAAIMLQDMYRSQAILQHQDRTLQRLENLIRRIRSLSNDKENVRTVDTIGTSSVVKDIL